MPQLFAAEEKSNRRQAEPLAARMRPQSLDEFVGQERFLGEGKLLRRLLVADRLGSVIFHGPPGTGKTTLAHILAKYRQYAINTEKHNTFSVSPCNLPCILPNHLIDAVKRPPVPFYTVKRNRCFVSLRPDSTLNVEVGHSEVNDISFEFLCPASDLFSVYVLVKSTHVLVNPAPA